MAKDTRVGEFLIGQHSREASLIRVPLAPGLQAHHEPGLAVERFLPLFASAWFRVPAVSRDLMRGHWMSPTACLFAHPFILLVDRLPGDEASGFCLGDGNLLAFALAYLLDGEEEAARAVVAHELAHVNLIAAGEPAGEEEAEALVRTWGFGAEESPAGQGSPPGQ